MFILQGLSTEAQQHCSLLCLYNAGDESTSAKPKGFCPGALLRVYGDWTDDTMHGKGSLHSLAHGKC